MSNKKEVWLPVKGYEGLYEVSSFGRVKGLPRVRYAGNGKYQNMKERILKGSVGDSGYIQVTLTMDKKVKRKKPHQLVAIAFLNHIPCGHKIVVDHIDNNKTNNRLDNLQLLTQRDNLTKVARGKSKYVGVYWRASRNRWEALIYIDGKQTYLGRSKCELAAAKLYQDKLKEINEKL